MAFRQVKIKWKLKAGVFVILDAVPSGDKLYYFLQRHVTKTLPRALAPTAHTAVAHMSHVAAFTHHGATLSQAKLLEFGAGWDLYSNFTMYCMGLGRQYVVDVRRWAKVPAINAVIKHLQTDPPSGAVRVPERLIRDDHLEADLGQYYGISYRAPADARKLPVQDHYFDLIATTSTLEHIPPAVIRPILGECYRVLRRGGLMSHVIDYSDHYAHSDASITEYNYLRFDERRWRKVNPSIHFQNRLRTKAYEQLFTEAGFELVEEVTWKGADESLARVPVNGMFQKLSREEMLELGGNFLLRKP